MKAITDVAADFDAIADALACETARETLTPAERALLTHVPANARHAIDVGCGDGVITRVLATRGMRVVGLDVSPRMTALARARTDPGLRIQYRHDDVMTADLPERTFDVVVSVAVAHHLALDVIVPRLVRLVAPGGTLLLQDVMNRRGLSRVPINVAAMFSRQVRRLTAPSRITSRVAAAYLTHGAGEVYLDASAVASVYAALLPGARVYHHLEWRYSVVWRAPEQRA